ncbi:hypothetical protein [Hymenobacter weizhouensis]|uniref:hypothetical protein n=1 Tax=Hymenobacter sp. YIM 151500-1 TaxID=2987689 RepID=UPI002225BD74|nr:hypothetical protein [Hymenobacter sp. YIM 151500-1]UYZ64047.1 hypothetical protein OIS53_04170 [Hymenobacter sp. YIM 151500-1]
MLHQVHESAGDCLGELHRLLFLHVLRVAVVPAEPTGTVEGVKYEGHPWRPFVRDDGKLLLFSSLGRAYDGLPKPQPGDLTMRPLVPVAQGHGFEILPDLAEHDLVLNPFSRHSWRLPRQEVAELLRINIVREPMLLNVADLPTQELRPLAERLPDSLRTGLQCIFWEQRTPDLHLAYVAEWNLPPDHPDAGLAVFVLTPHLDEERPHYLAPIPKSGLDGRPLPAVRFFYLDPQLFISKLPRVAEQLRSYSPFYVREGHRPPFF